MAGKRDPRHARTVGEPPTVGRRYVRDGKVRIEWSEDGRRRSRTVGANTAANRKRADQLLQEILSTMTEEQTDKAESTDEASEDSSTATEMHFEFSQTIHDAALRIMDAADNVADWLEDGISKIWSTSSSDADDVEEAVVEEVHDESDSSD